MKAAKAEGSKKAIPLNLRRALIREWVDELERIGARIDVNKASKEPHIIFQRNHCGDYEYQVPLREPADYGKPLAYQRIPALGGGTKLKPRTTLKFDGIDWKDAYALEAKFTKALPGSASPYRGNMGLVVPKDVAENIEATKVDAQMLNYRKARRPGDSFAWRAVHHERC